MHREALLQMQREVFIRAMFWLALVAVARNDKMDKLKCYVRDIMSAASD